MRGIAFVVALFAAGTWLSPTDAHATTCSGWIPKLGPGEDGRIVPPNPSVYVFAPGWSEQPLMAVARVGGELVPTTMHEVGSVPAVHTYRVDVEAGTGSLELRLYSGDRLVDFRDFEIDPRWTPARTELVRIDRELPPAWRPELESWNIHTAGDRPEALEIQWGTTRDDVMERPHRVVLPIDEHVLGSGDVPGSPWRMGLGRLGCSGSTLPLADLPETLWVRIAALQPDGSPSPATAPIRLDDDWIGPVPLPAPQQPPPVEVDEPAPRPSTWSVPVFVLAAAAMTGLVCGLLLSCAADGTRRSKRRQPPRV